MGERNLNSEGNAPATSQSSALAGHPTRRPIEAGGSGSDRAIETSAPKHQGRNLEVMWLFNRLKFDYKTIADFRKNNKHAFCSDVRFVRTPQKITKNGTSPSHVKQPISRDRSRRASG